MALEGCEPGDLRRRAGLGPISRQNWGDQPMMRFRTTLASLLAAIVLLTVALPVWAADEPAPAPAVSESAAAVPADAAPAAPKLDSGDTAWMLTLTALVLMMTVPGLALFYAGMVRKKNILATAMQ